MLTPLRGFSGMAATLAPLRQVSDSELDEYEEYEDDENEPEDEDQDEDDNEDNRKDYKTEVKPQLKIEKSPLVSDSLSSTSGIICSPTTSGIIKSTSAEQQSTIIGETIVKELKPVTHRSISNISNNVNARLDSMEGLPLSQSRQSDDFGSFTTALLEPPSSHHHDMMSMEMQQIGGYLDPNSFGGGSTNDGESGAASGSTTMDYDDFGQSSSMYDSFEEANKFTPLTQANHSLNETKYVVRYEQQQQQQVRNLPQQAPPPPQQQHQQQQSNQHHHTVHHPQTTHTIQRTYVPAYPVKTVDPMSHYGQGMRNVAHLPPNAAIPKRKSGGARAAAHKKPEPIDPLRVEFEVARNVSQILSATKQQKLAAEAQQKTGVQPAPPPPLRTNFPCPTCNRQMSNARNLQRHRLTCPPPPLISNHNNHQSSSMPPPMTPTTTPSSPATSYQSQQQHQPTLNSLATSTTTTTTMYTVTTQGSSSSTTNTNQSTSNYLTNGYDFKITDDLTYSDWSRSDSYSGPHSVSADPDFTEVMAFNEQLRLDTMETREEINTLDPNPQLSMRMGIDAELSMPLSLDCDDPIAHSSSASMSSNSQGTPQSYQCESCKKAVSSLRSLKRHHTTCKQYVAEFGISPEEGTSTSTPNSVPVTTAETTTTGKMQQQKRKPVKRPLEPDCDEKPPLGGRVTVTKVSGLMTPSRQMEPAILRLHGKSALLDALNSDGRNVPSQQVVSNPYQQPVQHFQQPFGFYPTPQQQQQPYQHVHNPYQNGSSVLPSQPHSAPLPSITASPWFSAMPSASSSSTSSVGGGVVGSVGADSDCDCGGVNCTCDGLPKNGLAANTCEDCSRQLCSASNLKRHRATCKMALQRLCSSSTSTSQPNTPQTPSQVQTTTVQTLTNPPSQPQQQQQQQQQTSKPSVVLAPQPTTATVTYTKVNGVGGTTAWSAEKTLTSPKIKSTPPVTTSTVPPTTTITSNNNTTTISNTNNTNTTSYVITSEPAASKPWITVGEHLRAQHVQQQKLLEAERTSAYHMQVKPIQHQQMQHQQHQQHPPQQQQQQHQQMVTVNQTHNQVQQNNHHHHQHQFQNQHHHQVQQQQQHQHQPIQKYGIVEHQNNDSAHISSHPIMPASRISFVSSFSDLGSDDDDAFDDIDMDAFDEEMQRGAVELYHQKEPISTREDYTITTMSKAQFPQMLPPSIQQPMSNHHLQGQKAKKTIIVKKMDSKIEMTPNSHNVSPLDSIITTEPLPGDVIMHEKKFEPAPIKNFEPVSIEIQPLTQSGVTVGAAVRTKKPQQEYQCPECLKTYSCRKNVKRHRMAVHKLTPDEIARKPAQVAPSSSTVASASSSSSSSVTTTTTTTSQPVTARRHTVAGTTTTEMMHTSPNFQFRVQQPQQPQQKTPQPQPPTQLMSPKSDWNTVPSGSNWNRVRSVEYVDEEQSKETARIAAELKRSAEEEMAEIEGKKPRTELAEADTTFTEDNEKSSMVSLPPLSTSSSLGLPSLSSPNNDLAHPQQQHQHQQTQQQHTPPQPMAKMQKQSSVQQMAVAPMPQQPQASQQQQQMLPPSSQQHTNHYQLYQTSSTGMGTSLPSIGSWNEYNYNMQPYNQIVPQQQQQQQSQPQPTPPSQQQPQPQPQTYTVQVVSQNSQPQQQPSLPQTPIEEMPPDAIENAQSGLTTQAPPPKKKKTHTCTGCHKILSSDYSLRRHRSTCLEVKNAQATKAAMQSSQRSNGSKKKSTSTTPTQPQDSEGESQHSMQSNTFLSPSSSEQSNHQQFQQQQQQAPVADVTMRDVEMKFMKSEDIPDSTTSQRHDRSTSPLTRDVDFSTGIGLPPPQPTTHGVVESKPIVEVKPQQQFHGIRMEVEEEQECGKFYANEWDLSIHRNQPCSDYNPQLQ